MGRDPAHPISVRGVLTNVNWRRIGFFPLVHGRVERPAAFGNGPFVLGFARHFCSCTFTSLPVWTRRRRFLFFAHSGRDLALCIRRTTATRQFGALRRPCTCQSRALLRHPRVDAHTAVRRWRLPREPRATRARAAGAAVHGRERQ
jgi:hypothetical protein